MLIPKLCYRHDEFTQSDNFDFDYGIPNGMHGGYFGYPVRSPFHSIGIELYHWKNSTYPFERRYEGLRHLGIIDKLHTFITMVEKHLEGDDVKAT